MVVVSLLFSSPPAVDGDLSHVVRHEGLIFDLDRERRHEADEEGRGGWGVVSRKTEESRPRGLRAAAWTRRLPPRSAA